MLSKDRRLSPLAHSHVNIQSSKASCHLLPHHRRHGQLSAPASDPLPRVSQAHVLKGITSFGILHSLFHTALLWAIVSCFQALFFNLALNSRLYTLMFDYTQVTSFQLRSRRAAAPTPSSIRKEKSRMMWGQLTLPRSRWKLGRRIALFAFSVTIFLYTPQQIPGKKVFSSSTIP